MNIVKSVALLLLFFISGCCPKKYNPEGFPPPPSCINVPEKIRVALVLGSGGVRGMAHVGVLHEFEKEGIEFDVLIGCSAGSLVASLYADNPDAESTKYAVENMRADTLLDINLWECRFGLSQGRALKKMLCKNLHSRDFEDLKIPLVVVAADLWSGQLVPIGSGKLIPAVRASCSIPLLFVPVEVNGRILVDGGIIDPVPVVVAKDLKADLIIAVDLCELLPKTFPTNLFGVASRSAEIAFLWQNQICTRGADVIIRPKMCNVGTFNDKMMGHLFEAGVEAAKAAIPRIKELIAKLPEKKCDNSKSRVVQLSCYHADDYICQQEFMDRSQVGVTQE